MLNKLSGHSLASTVISTGQAMRRADITLPARIQKQVSGKRSQAFILEYMMVAAISSLMLARHLQENYGPGRPGLIDAYLHVVLEDNRPGGRVGWGIQGL